MSTQPTEIIIGGEESVVSEADRQTIITDSLPYRDPSDKVFVEPPVDPAASVSSTRSLAGSGASMESRLAAVSSDLAGSAPLSRDGDSVYSTELTDSESQKTCDAKSRELPVDCEMPKDDASSSNSEVSSLCVNLPVQDGEGAAMKKFNAELDGLLKTSAPPFQVSTARLPPMLARELPPPEEQNSLTEEEFDDSKNNSVTRILNESHEAAAKSPENKHLRSYGY